MSNTSMMLSWSSFIGKKYMDHHDWFLMAENLIISDNKYFFGKLQKIFAFNRNYIIEFIFSQQ